MKITRYAACAMLVGILSGGCHHYVRVEVTVPARKAMPGVKNLAVGDFEEKTDLARQMSIGGQMKSAALDGVSREGFITTQPASTAGAANDAAIAAAAPSSADAVLVGAVDNASAADSAPQQVQLLAGIDQNTGQPIFVQGFKIDRNARLDVSFRVVRVPSGEFVCGDSASLTAKATQSQKTVEEASTKLPAPQNMVAPLVPQITRQLVVDLTPTTMQDRRRILTGKGDVDLGVQAAEHGLWDEAQAYWEDAAEAADPAVEPKIKAAAHFNLAVYYEIHNDFERAREQLNEARGVKDSGLFLKYLTLINEREKEFKRVEEQRESMDKQ